MSIKEHTFEGRFVQRLENACRKLIYASSITNSTNRLNTIVHNWHDKSERNINQCSFHKSLLEKAWNANCLGTIGIFHEAEEFTVSVCVCVSLICFLYLFMKTEWHFGITVSKSIDDIIGWHAMKTSFKGLELLKFTVPDSWSNLKNQSIRLMLPCLCGDGTATISDCYIVHAASS